MIRKSPVGVSPNITVRIDGAEINYESLMSINMHLSENEHDMCSLTMAGVPSRSVTDYIGRSVYVSINTGASFVQSFWGTIEMAAPEATTSKGKVNDSLFQEVVFTCLGCSYRMRGTHRKVWADSSLVDVVSLFVSRYGFSADVPADPVVFDSLIQNESDWQFLVRYSKLMGYSTTVHGTHIHIFDPHKAAGRAMSLHRLVTPARSSIQAAPGQLVSFQGAFAQRAADGFYFDTVATVHQDNGYTFDVKTSDYKGAEARFYSTADHTADNYAEAARIVSSSYRDSYDYTADATLIGAAGMVPGGIANLDRYDAAYDGLWYVRSVRHDIRSGSFLTDVQLAKNSVDTLSDLSAAAFRTPAAPVFINGDWTSSQKVVNAY
jgi:hypothetical protein